MKFGRLSILGYGRQVIRENRRALPFRLMASAAEKYLRAYFNQAFWNFDLNGETFAMTTFKRWPRHRSLVIWDIGANRGQWAVKAHMMFPDAEIHSFEIIPSIREMLIANTRDIPGLQAHAFGLSDSPGEVTVHLNPSADATSSIWPRLGGGLVPDTTIAVTCAVTTVDALSHKIATPEIMKIDVEGHELAVLRGGQALFSSSRAPAMIQIEYGLTYIPSGSTLKGLYDLLEPHGYAIGRLYPNYVDFKPYTYEEDTFRMGNLIAVKNAELKQMLS